MDRSAIGNRNGFTQSNPTSASTAQLHTSQKIHPNSAPISWPSDVTKAFLKPRSVPITLPSVRSSGRLFSKINSTHTPRLFIPRWIIEPACQPWPLFLVFKQKPGRIARLSCLRQHARWPHLRQLNPLARSEQLISPLMHDTPSPLSQRQTVTSRAAVRID